MTQDYPWTQADNTPELDQAANEAGIAAAEQAAAIAPLTCTLCGRKLNPKKIVWMEMSNMDGRYYLPEPKNPLPPEESQGLFPFGPGCYYKVMHLYSRTRKDK